MRSPDATIDRIAALLQQGLDHYGRNEFDEAVNCWQQVVELDPNQPDARDYLETAGVPCAPEPRAELDFAETSGPAVATPELEKFLRERRYEDALKVLYSARAANPKDQALSRSIRLLRERIAVDYASRLVNLDRVPVRGERISGTLLSSEERQVLSLVDGISSYGDIVAASPMGRLNTLRMLCGFLDSGLLTAISPSVSPPNARSGPHVRARAVQAVEQVPPTVPSSVPGRSSPLPSSSTRPASPTAPSLLAIPPPPAESGRSSGRSRSNPPPASFELPPSSRPSRPPPFSAGPDDGFDALFARATEAYLLRDYQRAVDLFTQCALVRPGDRRVQHNLKALQRRLSST
jgi:tetratricopeptide (TPR) repeat protein